jgi:hypothetical protein
MYLQKLIGKKLVRGGGGGVGGYLIKSGAWMTA